MPAAGFSHTVLLRTDGTVIAFGQNQFGQCTIPECRDGITYTQAAAGYGHTVLLKSDGSAVAFGMNYFGQIEIPDLPFGITYTQIAAVYSRTILLRSDGAAVNIGTDPYVDSDNHGSATGTGTPELTDDGLFYLQAAPGAAHTVLLKSDGTVLTYGNNTDGQCNIPSLTYGTDGPTAARYTQVATNCCHTILLKSDGTAVACGRNDSGECNIPALPDGVTYTQCAAGARHTVLLRSDGWAVAFGENTDGRCNVPHLPTNVTYTQVSTGYRHTVLLKSDGRAVVFGWDDHRQCDITEDLCPLGVWYAEDLCPLGRVVLLMHCYTDHCSFCYLSGDECESVESSECDSVAEIQKKFVRKLPTSHGRYNVVLTTGEGLNICCLKNPNIAVGQLITRKRRRIG